MNHLVDLGLLEKRQRLLRGGGYVHVYSPVDVTEVRERLTDGLYAWTADALELVEDVNREKAEALARSDGDGDDDAGRFRADDTRWNGATGESDDGRRLDRIPARRLFAFAWQDDHGSGSFWSGPRDREP